MSIFRSPIWLLACAFALCLPALAHAGGPFGPVGFEFFGDAQPWEQPNLTPYGGDPIPRNTGFFFTYDYLDWTISPPEQTTIGTQGLTAVVFFDGDFRVDSNSVTTGKYQADFTDGNRIEFGYVDECGCQGWLASTINLHNQNQTIWASDAIVMFVDPPTGPNGLGRLDGFVDLDGDGFDDDINGNSVYGRDGLDLGTPETNPNPPPDEIYVPPLDGIPDVIAPTDFNDAVRYPVIYDHLEAENSVRIWGGEIMKLWRFKPGYFGGQLELFAGGRFFSMLDDFVVQGYGGFLDDSLWQTKSDNNLVGPQVAFRWSRKRVRWTTSAEGRFMAAANFQNIRQRGVLATKISENFPQPRTNAPLLMEETGFESSSHLTEFSPLVEVRLQTSFQITKAISARGGYTAIWMDNIARASNMIEYRLPDMGILEDNNTQEVFINGWYLGFEYNR